MELQLFQNTLQEKTKHIEAVIDQYLPKEEGFQKTVVEAMNYSVHVGGKRLRPMFMEEVYHLFGGTGREIEPMMAAIEMIHTYSLVHDDLPAMDNDTLRRGKATTWKQYGEAMGVLAGDGLLNYAFETALSTCEYFPETNPAKVLEATRVLGKKAGIYGMIGGQTADVEAEGSTSLSKEQIIFIHEYKTAALIQSSMMVGAIMAGASKDALAKIEEVAYNIGIAFQIQDDILDIIGDEKELGKPIGSDDKNHKPTYATIYGLEQSQKDVKELSEKALTTLRSFGAAGEFLEELVVQLIHRKK